MPECKHQWEMTNVRFGFLVFEKCFHCNEIRSFFTEEQNPHLADEYREGDCFWNRVENAQSFMFDLECKKCGKKEDYSDLMGFMHCTGCRENCEIDKIQKKYEKERTWIMIAFGFLKKEETEPVPDYKLEILNDFFNQRRDTSRSKIKFVSFDLIDDLSKCKGIFIHDVGMLSREPQIERKPLF